MSDDCDENLAQVWSALGCAPNPDIGRPEVRRAMWGQALDSIRKYTGGGHRMVRENRELRDKVDRLTDALFGARGTRHPMSDDDTPTGPNWRDALTDLDGDWLDDDMAANDANYDTDKEEEEDE